MDIFQFIAAPRPLIVLHPKYVDEIKSHPYLDFEGAVRKVVSCRVKRILIIAES